MTHTFLYIGKTHCIATIIVIVLILPQYLMPY